MAVKIEARQEDEYCTLDIGGELSIYAVADLKDQLLGYLERSRTLEINLAEVPEIDTAGFQLLVLLKREAKKADKTLILVSHSAAILELLELLRMEAYFGDPLVLAS